MENRYADVGLGQVRGRRETGRLREQQDNVAGDIWYVDGEKRRGSVSNGKGWVEETRFDDLPMRSASVGGSRSSVISDGHATSSRHIHPRSAWVVVLTR